MAYHKLGVCGVFIHREQQELMSTRCFVAEVMVVRLTLLDIGIC